MSTTDSQLSSTSSSSVESLVRGSPIKRRADLGKQVTDSMRVEIGSKMILIQEEVRPKIKVTPSSSVDSDLDQTVEQDESRFEDIFLFFTFLF